MKNSRGECIDRQATKRQKEAGGELTVCDACPDKASSSITIVTYLGSKECWGSTHKRGSRASRGQEGCLSEAKLADASLRVLSLREVRIQSNRGGAFLQHRMTLGAMTHTRANDGLYIKISVTITIGLAKFLQF